MENFEVKDIKLTQYSHGAGCGCKIAPAVLNTILQQAIPGEPHPGLLVGNDKRDDAAVLDLGDGTAVVSTTDFFMPIVDDPHTFGKIASVNAISDVYAMGGTPILAIAILGWPIDKLSAEVANHVVEGAREACREAGIPLAGGHSIDAPEPIFGLAVTGRVALEHLKQNGGAQPGSSLFLTKPLGVGMLTTAQKKGKLQDGHEALAVKSMTTLNKIGAFLGTLPYIEAMTDVTGFGLMGHLTEMCEASEVSAEINFDAVPMMDRSILEHYFEEKCIPGGTNRNWASYGHKVEPIEGFQRAILCDPQTSGGLLVAVTAGKEDVFIEAMKKEGFDLAALGKIAAKKEKLVYVN
ncbi:MAG: selenide, water dikinase SelD [Saprospiraceae bacterium]|nr:selenide, water dikinase SelD [Saprospiraceae bacterium]